MEFVDGVELDEYIKTQSEQINEVFTQAVRGFAHLQRAGILHRDVCPRNLMVRQAGVVKIIDLGFGKKIEGTADFTKSITVNS